MKSMKIMIGSVDWALIDVLTASGELNRNDLKGAARERLKEVGKDASDRAIDKRIEKLKGDEILCSEKIGKYALYRLNPDADWEYTGVDLRAKKGIEGKHSGGNAIARYLLYKDHADDLKRVIKLWLKEIPIVSTEGVREWNYPVTITVGGSKLPFRGSGEVKLPVERDDEFIFNDLLFHLEKQDPEIINSWNIFKKMSVEHNAKGKDLVSKIEKEVTQQVNDACGVKLEISNKWEINKISRAFSNFVYNACITWAEEKMEQFHKNYKNFKSDIKCKEDSLEYWIEDQGFVRIAKGLLEEKEFKNKIDNVVNRLIEKSKVDYYPDGKEIVDITGKLTSIQDKIRRLLKKQLSYVVFKGECEFLKGGGGA